MMKLEEFAEINMGQSPESSSYNENKDGLPFFQGKADFGKVSPEAKVWCNKPAKIAEKNDILMSVRAPVGDLNIANEKCCIGRGLAGIRADGEKCYYKYLYYFLKSKYRELNQMATGSTFKAISKNNILTIEGNLPEIKKQKIIVDKLDKIQNLIDLDEQQIEDLNELIKSKFVKMFGNPNNNNKDWRECKVIDVCECMVPGRDKPKSFTGQTPWITIEDLEVNSITYESKSKLGLTEDEINEVKRKKIPVGSVIMSCVGNLGICSIAGSEMIINQQLHSFQCKDDINNIFLMYMLGERKWYMEKNASSTTVLYMNKTVCNSIPIFVPPIELQNEFADYVKSINKGKKYIQNNIEELKNLQNNLMYKYFN